MGYRFESGLVDQFTRLTTYAVGLILDPNKGLFEFVYEVELTARHLTEMFPFHAGAAIFHRHEAIVGFIAAHIIASGDVGMEVGEFLTCRVEFSHDNILELQQFCITIPQGGS